jgi:hypothetical protein
MDHRDGRLQGMSHLQGQQVALDRAALQKHLLAQSKGRLV